MVNFLEIIFSNAKLPNDQTMKHNFKSDVHKNESQIQLGNGRIKPGTSCRGKFKFRYRRIVQFELHS